MAFFKIENTNFYHENSYLSISDLVSWKKQRNAYNFKTLPEVAIIALKKNVFSNELHPFMKRIKGFSGSHYKYNSKILLCSEFGIGSSAIVLLLEELKELGVKKFVFVGVAGMLDNSINDNVPFIISKVYSSTGCSYFYDKNELLEYYDKEWFKHIGQVCNLSKQTAWSTDSPFRETPSMIDYYKMKGCSLVDMECAGVYAFSQFYKIPSVCILIGADRLTKPKWQEPVNFNRLLDEQRRVVKQLLKTL